MPRRDGTGPTGAGPGTGQEEMVLDQQEQDRELAREEVLDRDAEVAVVLE